MPFEYPVISADSHITEPDGYRPTSTRSSAIRRRT